ARSRLRLCHKQGLRGRCPRQMAPHAPQNGHAWFLSCARRERTGEVMRVAMAVLLALVLASASAWSAASSKAAPSSKNKPQFASSENIPWRAEHDPFKPGP